VLGNEKAIFNGKGLLSKFVSYTFENNGHYNYRESFLKERGKKLEEIVERIFHTQGYKVERNVIFNGRQIPSFEIDLIATSNAGEKIAIECKNFSNFKINQKDIFYSHQNSMN